MQWLNQVIKRVADFFSRSTQTSNTPSPEVKTMLKMLENTQEDELSCDETHDLLGEYTELEMSGEDAAQLLSMVHHHLELCPDCREEYEALINILEAQIS